MNDSIIDLLILISGYFPISEIPFFIPPPNSHRNEWILPLSFKKETKRANCEVLDSVILSLLVLLQSSVHLENEPPPEIARIFDTQNDGFQKKTSISGFTFGHFGYPPVNYHSYGKSPFSIGNTSSKGPFSIAMLVYRSVSSYYPPKV